jgi:histidinol-phosphate aminotransferase
MTREHGGPDAWGVPAWDFSTNSNACGPCPAALAALREADPSRYPDPAYTSLRADLASFHGVAPGRIVLAASASEFIGRLTGVLARSGARHVWRPEAAYGDYEQAARASGLALAAQPSQAQLLWLCEPSSPLGAAEPLALSVAALASSQRTVVLDRAYEPLRLSGRCSLQAEALDRLWLLWSPNKALGLTGIRGAYAVAPLHADTLIDALDAAAPSWPLGAHAVALLQAWVTVDTQQWIKQSRDELRAWKAAQAQMLQSLGWTCLPGDASFLCALPPGPVDAAALRAQGIKLRDATSLGMPGHWRLNVMQPAAQAVLQRALRELATPSKTLAAATLETTE